MEKHGWTEMEKIEIDCRWVTSVENSHPDVSKFIKLFLQKIKKIIIKVYKGRFCSESMTVLRTTE